MAVGVWPENFRTCVPAGSVMAEVCSVCQEPALISPGSHVPTTEPSRLTTTPEEPLWLVLVEAMNETR